MKFSKKDAWLVAGAVVFAIIIASALPAIDQCKNAPPGDTACLFRGYLYGKFSNMPPA